MSEVIPTIPSLQTPAPAAVPAAAPESTPAAPAQHLPEGIAERAAQLAAQKPTPEVPEVRKPPQKADTTVPDQKPTDQPPADSYANLNAMLGAELLGDPQAAVVAGMLETLVGDLDVNRAFGKAAAEDDARFIDEAYLVEKLGEKNAKLAVEAAKQLLGHAERISNALEAEVFQAAGGKDRVEAAAKVFNETADDVTKAAMAKLLDSGDKASMQYALKQIVDFAVTNGKLVVHNDPALGQPSAEKGLSREEYAKAIQKHNLSHDEYTRLQAQRRLGMQQGL